jgi:hypothetical protein
MVRNRNATSAQEPANDHRRPARRWLGKRLGRLRSAVKAGQAGQAQLGAIERQERDRLSMLVRARANGLQQRLHERFPHLPYRFIAPVAEVSARPRIDETWQPTPAR